MSISIISSVFTPSSDYANSIAHSVTASAGDIIFITLGYKDESSAVFSAPTWNSQTATPCGVRYNQNGLFLHDFYIRVASSATANLTSSSGDSYTRINSGYAVIRSSGNLFPSVPLKDYQNSFYTSGAFVNPSISNTLTSSDIAISSLLTTAWDADFNVTTATFTAAAPSTLIDSATSTAHPSIKHSYLSKASGTGTTASAFTRSNSDAPKYLMSSAVFYEAAQQITSINGSNPITAGQTGIAVIADGFTAKPTGVTATYESGSKSISATIGAGSATNFDINIQDRVDGEDWPLNNSAVTFTFTYGSETASLNKNIVKKDAEVVYTFSGAVTTDPQSIAYHLTEDGFTAEGGEHVYLPYGDLALTAEGGWTVTDAGTFPSWFRPATGTGAGNVYEYQWQVTEAGISPISSKAITAKALTCAGLSASGFVCTPM